MVREITMNEFEKVMWNWSTNYKSVFVSIEEPITSSHVFRNFECDVVDNEVFMDGENTVALAMNFDKNKVCKVAKRVIGDKEYYSLYFSDGIIIGFNELKSNPKMWTRDKMNKARANGETQSYV
jgi:hypothetical protein